MRKKFTFVNGQQLVAYLFYNLEQVFVVSTDSELLLLSKTFVKKMESF